MGPGFTGPLALVVLGSYRLSQMVKNKIKSGSWIDYSTSNWFTPQHKFKRYNLLNLAGNFIPNLLGLVILSYGFKFAALGNLNQGILPTLTSLAGVYCSIVFYF